MGIGQSTVLCKGEERCSWQQEDMGREWRRVEGGGCGVNLDVEGMEEEVLVAPLIHLYGREIHNNQ